MEEHEKECTVPDNYEMSAGYEYDTLMRLLGVSVSKHLLDDRFTLIWANDFYYELIGWPKDEYEAAFHNRPDLYYQYHDSQKEWEELSETVLKCSQFRTKRISYGFPDQAERRKLCLGAIFGSVF